MAEFELSKYQKDIINFFETHPGENMLVEALAGCSKTYTITQLTKKTTTSDVYLAFNTAIADECRSKITNPKTKIYTLHSLALAIMNYNIGGGNKGGGIGQVRTKDSEKAQLDNLKIHKIVDEMITNSYGRRFNWEERNFLKNNYVQLYNLARLTCSMGDERKINQLVDEHGLFVSLEQNFSMPDYNVIYAWIQEIDEISLRDFEIDHVIDYTDMIYITLKKLQAKEWQPAFYQLFTNIYIDEAQDANLSLLNFIRFIKRKNGRYVFVMDSRQAIYNFAGADANSFSIIPKLFKPIKKFELPINYRCPTSHLEYVNKNFDIPIQARPNAPKGEIHYIEKNEVVDYVQTGDMIISRKNKWFAPLLLQLPAKGIPVYIEDKEMVENLKRTIKAQKVIGCSGLKHNFEEAVKTFNEKVANIINQSKDPDSMVDIQEAVSRVSTISNKLDNINFILSLLNPYMSKHNNATSEEFLAYLSDILNTTSPKDCVRICSVHKAKGLEAPNVFVLNQAKVCSMFMMSPAQKEQEVNLAYISVTRAMDKLYLVAEDEDDG